MGDKTRKLTETAPGREPAGGHGPRALGLAVSKIAEPILARRGGGTLARLKSEWTAIVGAPWAQTSWPIALGRDGALRLRVASAAAALDLQHRAPLFIDRINLYFGHVAVSRLKLVQGPLPLPPPVPASVPRRLGPAAADALDRRLAEVAAPELRAALARLGRAVLAEPDIGPEAGVAPAGDPD